MKSGRAAGSGVTDPGKEIELISWVEAPVAGVPAADRHSHPSDFPSP